MYRVILLVNGKYRKTLHRSITKETSFRRYRHLIEENQSIMFPKQYISYNGIKRVRYKICVIKVTEEDDEFRLLRDNLGKTYIESPFGDWTILSDNEYQVEETFWQYGKSPQLERVTIHDILKPLVKPLVHPKNTKQVIVVHNKLLIYNEEQFDMIICKCKRDAQRLHHTLAKAAQDVGIKYCLFMGTASPATVSRMYDVILDNTDWSIEKIRRTTTRP